MPEVRNYTFSLKEIAEALIKYQGLHEGYWGISIEFGFAATNINTSPDEPVLVPAAIIPVSKIGIQRVDEPNNLTVDAAKINPQKGRAARPSTKSLNTEGTASTAGKGEA